MKKEENEPLSREEIALYATIFEAQPDKGLRGDRASALANTALHAVDTARRRTDQLLALGEEAASWRALAEEGAELMEKFQITLDRAVAGDPFLADAVASRQKDLSTYHANLTKLLQKTTATP